MTSSDVAVPAGLAITEAQTGFTEQQVAVLRTLGVETAEPAELELFFHVAKRSGLDPFAKQIYMLPRETEVKVRVDVGGGNSRLEARRVTKQSIQTGIDGYRLIGMRAAKRENVAVGHDPAMWCGDDEQWRQVFKGVPAAAQYTIRMDGVPVVTTCLFDEFAQYSARGELTAMWKKMPCNQLAIRAEAACWRKAFPADFSGIGLEGDRVVVDEDGAPVRGPAQRARGVDALREAARGAFPGSSGVAGDDHLSAAAHMARLREAAQAAGSSPPPFMAPRAGKAADTVRFTADERRRGLNLMFMLFGEADIAKDDREDRLIVTSEIVEREVGSSDDLTDPELYRLVHTLRGWHEDGVLGSAVTKILNTATIKQMDHGYPGDEDGDDGGDEDGID